MTYKELIKKSRGVIKGKLRLDFFSRFYKAPVFKQKRSKISAEEIYELQKQLLAQSVYSHLETGRSKYYLKVLRASEGDVRNRYWLHLLLFLFTVLTTTITGAIFLGRDAFSSWKELSYGLPYSFALMTILLFHEMGHYIAARYYKMKVTLPYFIPLFLPAFHPGTMGAFIRMRSSVPNKKALFDIGIAGPLAGFAASIFFLSAGFYHLLNMNNALAYVSAIHPLDNQQGMDLILGSSILFDAMGSAFGAHYLPMNEIYHFPFIFAGWLGLLVTSLNLMPIGQLDGGHITYAMFGDRASKIAMLSFGLLILLNVYLISSFNSYVWVLWPVIIFFFIKFRHPPTMDNSVGLDLKRKILGWLAYIIFIVSFSPIPVYISLN